MIQLLDENDKAQIEQKIKTVSDETNSLKGDLEQLKQNGTGTGTGLSTEAIDKLEEVGNYLVYTTADGGSKWTELISILRNGSSGGGSGEAVPATGISLDKTALSFTDSATQTLVATVEPSDTTDKVVWTSSAESVATVTNGVVKPLSNGSATITATCGSVSATCSVTVDIAVEEQVTLASISATYTGGDVAVGTVLTNLTGITVTGTYSDGSTSEITGYTLSGEILEGSNAITVSYDGLTTTFTVTGVAESVRVYGVDLTWEFPDYNKWSENGDWFHTHYNETTASIQIGNGFEVNRVYSKPIDGSVYKYFRVPCISGNQYAVSNNVAFFGCDSPNALIEEGHTVTQCNKQMQFVSCNFAEDLENEGIAIFTPAEQFDYYYIRYQPNNSLTKTYPDLLGIFDANILENPLANPTE